MYRFMAVGALTLIKLRISSTVHKPSAAFTFTPSSLNTLHHTSACRTFSHFNGEQLVHIAWLNNGCYLAHMLKILHCLQR